MSKQMTDDEVLAQLGPVCPDEYQAGIPEKRPETMRKFRELLAADDDAFVDLAEGYIFSSAFWNSRAGNHMHDHALATACYSISTQRFENRDGHEPRCRELSLYQQAYNRVVRSNGYPGMAAEDHDCNCEEIRTNE